MKQKFGKVLRCAVPCALVAVAVSANAAGSDVSAITDAATTTFGAVATLCVTIGTFMIGYKLARKVR